MTVGEREVTRIVRHRMTFGGNTHTYVREGEVGGGCFFHGNRLNRIFLMLICCSIKGIVQQHIRIQRIIFRTGFLLRNRIIQWGRHLCLGGEELTQLHIRSHAICSEVIHAARTDTILQSAEAL